jgi:general secretion pathway protein A
MDRTGAVNRSESCVEPPDDVVLPSRQAAINLLRAAIEACDGPVLLTGEPGVGKSWVARRAVNALPLGWRWATVALEPSTGTREFEAGILHAFGLPFSSDPIANAAELDNATYEAGLDGIRWGVIVEEAHNASDSVLESVRVRANRAGGFGALAGLLLVGQTSLARRVSTRSLAGLEARLAGRIVLARLGIEEFQSFLASIRAPWSLAESELAHRAVEGNPLRALRLARAAREKPQPVRSSLDRAVARRVEAEDKDPGWQSLPVVPAKPPIALGEGMIEVGWDAPGSISSESELDPDPTASETSAIGSLRSHEAPSLASRRDAEVAPSSSGVPITDRYAALQAWTEWARNQGRQPLQDQGSEDAVAEMEPAAERETSSPAPSASPAHPSVWVEGQHEFAPYSQLFTRLRQPRDQQ